MKSSANYLFAGSDAGADRIATACTILGSAHLNGIDPLAYLTDVTAKLQTGWPMGRIDELLPDASSKYATQSCGEDHAGPIALAQCDATPWHAAHGE